MTQPAADSGAQSGDNLAQGGQTGDGTGQGDAGAQSGTSQQQGDTTGTGAQSGADSPVHTAAEMEAQRARTRAADQRAAQLDAELKQIRDKDLPELDKLKRDADEWKAKAEKAEAELRNQRISNAFLKDNSFAWQDPAVALSMIDSSKLEIDDQGQVVGLKPMIEGLAKQYPWMLKPKEGDGDAGQQAGAPPMNQGNSSGTGKPSKSEMAKRFPAIASKLGG